MRRAIARDFASIPSVPVRVVVTLDQRLPDEPGPWEIVRVREGEESAVLCSWAAQADYALIVAPECDGILHDRTVELERAGRCSLGSSAEAVGLAGDKARLARRLAEQGVATPPTCFLGVEPRRPAGEVYPAVLKPVDGAGGLDAYYIDSPEAWPQAEPRRTGWVVQPYISGAAMSASYLVDQAGEPHLIAIGDQRIHIQENRFIYLGGDVPTIRRVDDRPLRSAVRAIPGLCGFVGVDFVVDRRTNVVTVIEVNPRPTTSCVGLCALLPPGRFAEAWLSACGGLVPGEPERAADLARTIARRRAVRFAADGAILGA